MIKVACVGLGWVTTHRHIPVMRKNPAFNIVGVIDRKPDRARAVAHEINLSNFAQTADLSEVDWIDKVDAVTVGTAPFGHFNIIRQALTLGKHVLTEKPFTMSLSESDELIDLAKHHRKTLCVVHNFQFARSAMKLSNDIEAGRLGATKSLSAVQLGNPLRRLPEWYQELPLGLFYDESPHLLYLLRKFCVGDMRLENVYVHPATDGGSTPSRIDARYSVKLERSTLPVNLSCNFDSPVSEWYLMVFGTQALGIVDVFRDIYIRIPNDGEHVTRTVLRTSLATSWHHWTQHLTSGIAHLRGTLFYGNEKVFDLFANALMHGAHPKGITAEDARAVQKMQFDIVQAAGSSDD